ncbi:hypothetical protein ACJJTC_008276 [Scirpophaga incertulas]
MSVVAANLCMFEDFCVLLQTLYETKHIKRNTYNSKATKIKAEQFKILSNYYHDFKIKAASIEGKKDSSFFPILRLLLPNCERDRSSYNLKETKLGLLLVKVLSISNQSPTAQKLLNYRSVRTSQDSDFAGVAYYAIKNILGTRSGNLTIGQINEMLDKIATAEVGNKSGILDEVFSYALRNLVGEQVKWFFRLVLKDLKLGIGTNLILAAFHPDAPEHYKIYSNLSKVCLDLEEGETRPLELGIKVFYAVSPMLSERLDVTQVCQQLCPEKVYIVENKFDGERFQIHMENGVFQYFSRNGYPYSDNYGKSYDKGMLTPYLRNCFNPEVSSFILDGEMMGWHKVNQHFSSKGMAFDVKKITENSKFQPCFCAFDVLYYNGKTLVGPEHKGGMPLNERLKILDSIFTDKIGVIQHSERKIVKDIPDILYKLNQARESQEEGIVVKDFHSFYIPSKRNAGWYKIKPEYTEGAMTDLDLVIIGADEAESKKQGRAKSFHVACVDKRDTDDAKQHSRWLCVGRVATGLSYEERERICCILEKQWVQTRDALPPPQLFFNKEKPDFWLLPDKSIVLQVRATELIRTNRFGTDYTLRFPRIVRVREDKPTADIMTLSEFDALVSSPSSVIKLSSQAINQESLSEGNEKVRRKRPTKVIEVPEQFRTAVSELVEVTSKALAGRKICILSDDVDCKKPELRRIVESHSGIFVSNVGSDTWCAIVGRITGREKKIIKSEMMDIATTTWLRNLPLSEGPCNLLPIEMLSIKKETRLSLCRDYDIFGDNYTVPVNESTLKTCFEKMENDELSIYLTKPELLKLDEELFEDGNPYSFLRPCYIYVSNNIGILALQAKMFGAEICDLFSPNLTHVVVCKTSNSEDVKKVKQGTNAKIVSEEWLKECFQRRLLVSEDKFIL